MAKIQLTQDATSEFLNDNNLTGTTNVIFETINEHVYYSEKSYYEYLYDMKSDEDYDNCDYCAAFMFV